MKLIEPLAAGIVGAEGGSVTLTLRGTSTAAVYYADFEATQQFPGTGVPLDSNGRLVAYVSALVDVVVHDSLGVDVVHFVAGDYDAAVEVISPSFTGVDYTSGASGTQKPTNLEVVLDAWFASAGAPDWKVLVNGTPTSISVLASSSFINVKSYGAAGNGVADDGAAITAASAAATALGGGTVYFPPGTYRITTRQTLPANVLWVGGGGMSSKLAMDSVTGTGAIGLSAAPAGSISGVTGMWIGAINGANPGCSISGSAASTGEYHFIDCVFGNDSLSNTFCYQVLGSIAALKTMFTRCYLKINSGGGPLLWQTGVGRLVTRDCDLISSQTNPGIVVLCDDGGIFDGNRFDGSAGTAGTLVYISAAPVATGSQAGGMIVTNNRFAANLTLGAANTIALRNTAAAPVNDIFESNNIFGDPNSGAVGITPYSYTADGYVSFSTTFNQLAHLSRVGRTEVIPSVLAAESANPKAFGTTVLRRMAGAALTINANKGSQGDRWTLHIVNNTGGGMTVSAGTNVIFDPGVTAGTLVIGAAGFSECELTWLPSNGGVGFWYLTSKAVTT